MNAAELRRLLDEAREKMKALVAKSRAGTFSAEDQAAYDVLEPEMIRLKTELDAAEKRERSMAEFEREEAAAQQSRGRAAGTQADGERAGNGVDSKKTDMRSIAQRVIESDAFKAFLQRGESGMASVTIDPGFYHAGTEGESASMLVRGGSRLFARETRGLVYTGSFPTGAVEVDRVPGILQQSFIRPTVRDAFGSTPTRSNLITFVRELLGSHTSGATWVIEPTSDSGSSGLKTQSTLVFDGDEAPVREVATWIPVSENIADDLPGLESLINFRLLDFLAQEEDDALLNGSGVSPELEGLRVVSGVQVADAAYFGANPVQDVGQSNEDFNRILAAIGLVQDPGLAQASFIFLNPAHYQYLQTASNANRDYYGGGPFVNGLVPRIWGVPVIQTNKLDVGDEVAIIGDGRMAEVRDRQVGTIDVGYIDDQFVRDMKTIRAKERIAFPIYRPGAFVEMELALN